MGKVSFFFFNKSTRKKDGISGRGGGKEEPSVLISLTLHSRKVAHQTDRKSQFHPPFFFLDNVL